MVTESWVSHIRDSGESALPEWEALLAARGQSFTIWKESLRSGIASPSDPAIARRKRPRHAHPRDALERGVARCRRRDWFGRKCGRDSPVGAGRENWRDDARALPALA